MLQSLAVAGYRSLKELVIPLSHLTVITGPNGSGKSSLYRALRLLADTARGQLVHSLAREGGLRSVLWAGPEVVSREMQLGLVPVQGTLRKKPISLKLGFASDEYTYTCDLGLPVPSNSAFFLDPIIKRECIFLGASQKTQDLLIDRKGPAIRIRNSKSQWQTPDLELGSFDSLLSEFTDPESAPAVIRLRDWIRSWRFYDHFRTDQTAPSRGVQIGTYTPVLGNDGAGLAAALQTIREIGNADLLEQCIADAFPGSQLSIDNQDARFEVQLYQPGMLRPLRSSELSDGTLRYLLLVAALLTPRPPQLMVLNEPETSLHPDLIPALARLISEYSQLQQILLVTHSQLLVQELDASRNCAVFVLEKSFGATQLVGVDPFDLPQWKWPAR
ncbi:MAG: AAA family ATPase [Planctomycetales bacterium]|nr:AAA family ATPase [Planctomycetales bacterium]